MHPPIDKPAASTPTSANVDAYRDLVTRPRREQRYGHFSTAFWFTGLARALLPWHHGGGDENGLSRSRRSFFNLQLIVLL